MGGQTARRFTQNFPGITVLSVYWAAALALAGRAAEAQVIVKQALDRVPGIRIRMFVEIEYAAEILDKLIAGARLAGLPE